MLKCLHQIANVFFLTLRLYPILPASGRTSLRETVLPRGGRADGKSTVFVPENSRVINLFYGLHRDPEIFGPNIEEFNLDRWTAIKPRPWEHLPLNDDPRYCLAMKKALNEVEYVIARLVQQYERLECRDEKPW